MHRPIDQDCGHVLLSPCSILLSSVSALCHIISTIRRLIEARRSLRLTRYVVFLIFFTGFETQYANYRTGELPTRVPLHLLKIEVPERYNDASIRRLKSMLEYLFSRRV